MKKSLCLVLICLMLIGMVLFVSCDSSGNEPPAGGASSGNVNDSSNGTDNTPSGGEDEPNKPQETKYALSFYVGEQKHAEVSTNGKSALTMPEQPTKKGYKFEGWYFDDQTFTNQLRADTLMSDPISANTSVYAKFTLITYKATFVIEGQTIDTLEFTVENTDVTPPVAPARAGYSFAWESYTLDAADVTVNGAYTPETYTLTFMADGQQVGTLDYTVESTNLTASYPAIPSRDGYTAEWGTLQSNMGNQTVTAIYTPIVYKATFTVGGQVLAEIDYTVETVSITEPDIPAKSGYSSKWSEYTLAIGGVSVEAIYTPIPVSVTLILNYPGAINAPYTTEDGYVKMVPERTGYQFNGWWLSSGVANGEPLLFERFDTTQLVLSEGLVLYAEWIELPHDDKQLSAPSVSVSDKTFTWSEVVNADSYKLELYGESGLVLEQTLYDLQWTFPEHLEAGFYRIAIRANGNGYNTLNSSFVTKYYSHNMLPGISGVEFDIATSILTFSPVAGAERYEIYVDGELVQNLDITQLDLSAFEAGSHTVKIIAIKEGWASSSYTTHITKKRLKAPDAQIRFDQQTLSYVIEWDAVVGANEYIITINGRELRTSELSYSLPCDHEYLQGLADVELSVSAFDTNADHFISTGNKQLTCDKYAKLDVQNDNGGLTLTVNGGSQTVGGFVVGEQVTLNAQVAEGYNFVGWYVGGELKSTELSFTYTVVDGENVVLASSTCYTVTTTISDKYAGIYTEYTDKKFSVGSTVSLTTTVEGEYNFVGWFVNGELASTELTYTFEMPAENLEIEARYSIYKISVVSASDNGGKVTNYKNNNFAIGTELTIRATPNNGFRFVGWFVDGECVSTEAEYTFTMEAKDVVFTAQWEAIRVTLHYVVNGEIYKTEEYTNDNPITAFPTYETQKGEHFRGWFVDEFFTYVNNSYNNNNAATSTLDVPVDENHCAYLYGGTYVGTDGLNFVYEDGKYTVSGSTTNGTMTIPGTFNGVNIWSAKSLGSQKAHTLIFSEGISVIDTLGSFNELTAVNIPASVIELNGSFVSCRKLKTVTIAEGSQLTTLSGNVFNSYCAVKELELPATVRHMAGWINFPESLVDFKFAGTIEDWCEIEFYSTSSNPMYAAENFYMKNAAGEYELVTGIEVPASVKSIGKYQFYDFENVTTYILHEGLESIGEYAFAFRQTQKENNLLSTITIPASVKTIGNNAFRCCDSLKTLDFASNSLLEEFNGNMLSACTSLTNITIPSVKKLTLTTTSDPDYKDSLVNIYYQGDLELWFTYDDPLITYYADHFYIYEEGAYVELTDIVVPESVKVIPKGSFRGASYIKSLKLHGSVESIGELAFFGTGITELDIPASLKSIGTRAFAGSALTAVVIPETLESIGAEAFIQCEALTSLDLDRIRDTGDSTQTNYLRYLVGDNVSKISTLIVRNGAIPSATLSGFSSLARLTIPFLEDSKTAPNKRLLGSLFGTEAFDNANAMKQKDGTTIYYVPIPLNYVEILGGKLYGYAFYNLWFTELVIGENVTYLGANLTKGCKSIQTIRYNAKNIESVDEDVFIDAAEGNTKYKLTLYIGENVEVIPDNLFKDIRKLNTVNFAKSGKLTKIGNNAFELCGIKRLSIPSGVVSIGDSAFSYCTSMEYLYLPETLERIGDGAFSNCGTKAYSLEKVTIPASVTYIGTQAFDFMGTSLISGTKYYITFADTQSQWKVTKSYDTTVTEILTTTDALTNATNLRVDYRMYYWEKIVLPS